MRSLLALLVASAIMTSALPAIAAGRIEQIEIPGDQVRLKALLYRPEGDGPFPAVLGLHNCTGLINRSGSIGARYADWAQRLASGGFVVLLPDSNASRGLGSQCGVRNRAARVERERVDDATAARVWLQKQSWIAPERISLIGWSSGAIASLWATRARMPMAEGPDFRSAIAFYPGCRRLLHSAWSARVPTLILIGRADDQTSAAACQQMVAGARGRSAQIEIVVYPGAHHDFDHPRRPLQVRTGYAFSVDGTGRVHSGTHTAARADALKRVPAWLAR